MNEHKKITNSYMLTSTDKIKFIFHFVTKVFLYSIFTALIGVFLVLTVYFGDLIYNIKRGNTNYPLFNAFVIVSKSMVPTIKVNDAIVIKRKQSEQLNVGDIITFSSSDPAYLGLTVTHRIVGKQLSQSGDYIFRTKGDNNTYEDQALVKENNIYGKVILKIPKLGTIKNFVTASKWSIIMVVCAMFVIIIDVFKISHPHRNKRKCEDLEII